MKIGQKTMQLIVPNSQEMSKLLTTATKQLNMTWMKRKLSP
jgi:hypothetical protein